MTSHSIDITVYYEDTDAGGVVYYANYLKYAERGRTELLKSKGILQSELGDQEDRYFVVKRAQLELHKPARLDNIITVTTSITSIKGARLSLAQSLSCDGVLLAEVDVDIVCVNSAFSPKRVPTVVLNALAS